MGCGWGSENVTGRPEGTGGRGGEESEVGSRKQVEEEGDKSGRGCGEKIAGIVLFMQNVQPAEYRRHSIQDS
jgi:hypothetical protein